MNMIILFFLFQFSKNESDDIDSDEIIFTDCYFIITMCQISFGVKTYSLVLF